MTNWKLTLAFQQLFSALDALSLSLLWLFMLLMDRVHLPPYTQYVDSTHIDKSLLQREPCLVVVKARDEHRG